MKEILSLKGENRCLQKRLDELISGLPNPRDYDSAEALNDAIELERIRIEGSSADRFRQTELRFRAISNVLIDLSKIGWVFAVSSESVCGIRPDFSGPDTKPARRQALISQRNEQLRGLPVQRFVKDLERPRFHNGRRVSIFSLMRDGREIAASLAHGTLTEPENVIKPYLQVVDSDSVCDHTGIRLMDIWRYFRHGWSNPYNSIPGRSMLILVRDEASKFHPVIGILALSSASVRLATRDRYMGWEPESVIELIESEKSAKIRRWLLNTVNELIDDIYVQDLIEDGLLSGSSGRNLTQETVKSLREEAEHCRHMHTGTSHAADHKLTVRHCDQEDDWWERQARLPLFRSKRCEELAALYDAEGILLQDLSNSTAKDGLSRLITHAAGRKAVGTVAKRLKARQVGTAIADLTVCGAVPPYSHILGGKLMAMLAVSPETVSLYKERYKLAPSVIASSMAGRRMVRSADLVFITTTSLYGVRPSQYDRVAVPVRRLGKDTNEAIRYKFLKKTIGFGTFQFTSATSKALGRYLRTSKNGSRVNYIFGEGASPRLRNIRDGLTALHFDDEQLLQHGQSKCIYGAALIENVQQYLLGIERKPKYLFNHRKIISSSASVANWWFERWLSKRRDRADWASTIERLEREALTLPITHGARVQLPHAQLEQEDMFEF